jgi:hypothetical protein
VGRFGLLLRDGRGSDKQGSRKDEGLEQPTKHETPPTKRTGTEADLSIGVKANRDAGEQVRTKALSFRSG